LNSQIYVSLHKILFENHILQSCQICESSSAFIFLGKKPHVYVFVHMYICGSTVTRCSPYVPFNDALSFINCEKC